MRKVRSVVGVVLACVCLVGIVPGGSNAAPSPNRNTNTNGDPAFTSKWMGELAPVIANFSVLDMSLPGTHDSMTWDLSDTVSDDANDISADLAWVLHEFHDFADVGKYIRNQSITQGLNMTEQLEAGARFIDFRIVYTAGPTGSSTSPHDWYCLHFVESNSKALKYLQAARDWMDAHPTEVVVFWVSRHGSPCRTDFPDVSVAEKQAFWNQVETTFQGIMFDSSVSSTNTTTYEQLISRNHRAVFYVSDGTNPSNFTAGSPRALNGCTIDNWLGPNESTTPSMLQHLDSTFATATARRISDKSHNRFFLMSMSGGASKDQLKDTAWLTYIPFIEGSEVRSSCAASYNIPNMTDWCPMHLQDDSQLSNYYSQISLEAVVAAGSTADFPNAIYIDGLDKDGTIRTGKQLFGPLYGPEATTVDPSDPHAQAKYAYVDTMLLANVRRACSPSSVLVKQGQASPPASACSAATTLLEARRAANPLQRWDDPSFGRLSSWP